MKEFIRKFAKTSEKDVKSISNLMTWLDIFDIGAISFEAIDELVELAEIAEDRSKIALIDLFRLLVLNGKQSEYIFTKHWELVEICVIGYLQAQNLKDTEAKVI